MTYSRAIFWDHDGLLVDSESVFFAATRKIFADYGALLTQAHWSAEYLGRGLGTAEVAQGLGIAATLCPSLIETRNRLYRERLSLGPPLCEGAANTLRHLHGKLPMALVTGSQRGDLELMHQNTGLLELFDTIVARTDYARPKPDPEPYLVAMSRLGVPPGDCLAIEDSQRGMRSAIAAGMRCIVVPGPLTLGQKFEGAHAIEVSVQDVLKHITLPSH